MAFKELALVRWVTGEPMSGASSPPSPGHLESDKERAMALAGDKQRGCCDIPEKPRGAPWP